MSNDPLRNGHAPLAHDQVQDLLAAYLAGEVTPGERAAIARHLSDCPACRQALAEAQHIRTLLATLGDEAAHAPRQPSLVDAVIQRLGPTPGPSPSEMKRGEGDGQAQGEIAHSSQFTADRPVSGTESILGASSNSNHTARRADHALRSTQGVTSPMQAPPKPETPVAPLSKPRPRPAPFVALAAAALVALLAVGLFVTHVPRTQSQAGLVKTAVSSPGVPTPFARGTPAVTPAPGVKTPIQSDIKSYNFIINSPTGPTIIPKNPTSVFKLGQVIYIVMNLNATTKAGDVVSAKWFFNSIDITPDLLRSNAGCCAKTVRDTGKVLQVYFALKPTTTGTGHVEIYYNDTLAYTIYFQEVTKE